MSNKLISNDDVFKVLFLVKISLIKSNTFAVQRGPVIRDMKYIVQYVHYRYNFHLLSADASMVSINDFYKLNEESDFMWRKHYMRFILNGYVIIGPQ